MHRFVVTLLVLCGLLTAAQTALARVKLITLPVRERVEIQLDHPRHTLVEEERVVPLVRGVNQVDFSWANTHIDPDTIVFRVLGPATAETLETKVLAVSYPPNENALIWSVSANQAGAARVRISYILGGLNKSFSYRAMAAHDEKTLTLSQYLRVANYANEEYGESGIQASLGERLIRPLGRDQTRKILLEKYAGVPVNKVYVCDPTEHGYLDRTKDKLLVPMYYVWKNDREHNLGKAALPYGKARIFQEDGKGGSAFIGEDWGHFTPLDDEMRLYLGVAQDIVVVRKVENSEQKRIAGNLYDHEVVLKYELENFKDRAVVLDLNENPRALRDRLRGNNGREVQWLLGEQTTLGRPDPEKSTFEKLLFHVELPPAQDGEAEKITHQLHLVFKNEWR